MPKNQEDKDGEKETLEKCVSHILEEARMVLPGVQALFGFQLIAVFNSAFDQKLSAGEQTLHLGALALVAVCAGLLMAPAAFHRQVEPRDVSESFATLATWLLNIGMAPLMIAVSLDFYLIARIILGDADRALGLALGLFAVLAGLWYAAPQAERMRRNRSKAYSAPRIAFDRR